MTTYFEDKYAIVTYEADKKLMEVTWKETGTDSTKYRFTLTKALAVFKQYEINTWISDMKNVYKVPKEDVVWVKKILIPNIATAGQLKRALFVVNDENSEEMLDIQRIAERENVVFKFFESLKDAYAWFDSISGN